MANAKTVCCSKCKAENPSDYTFCWHCRCAPSLTAPTAAPKKTAAKKKAAAKRSR